MDTGTSNVHSLYSNARPLVENYNPAHHGKKLAGAFSTPIHSAYPSDHSVTPRLSVENLRIEDLLLVHKGGTPKAVVETGC